MSRRILFSPDEEAGTTETWHTRLCIYQAYSEFRPKIPHAQVQIPKKNLPHFDSLCDLLECFIPTVLWFEKTKNKNSFELRCRFFRMQLFLLCALDSGPYVKVFFF